MSWSIDAYFSTTPTFFYVLMACQLQSSCWRRAALDKEYFWLNVSNISLRSESSRIVAKCVLSILIEHFFLACLKPNLYISFFFNHISNTLFFINLSKLLFVSTVPVIGLEEVVVALKFIDWRSRPGKINELLIYFYSFSDLHLATNMVRHI